MKCVWIIFFSLWGATSFAETPLGIPNYRYQYEINSESVYFSDTELLQADLRLLIGRRFDTFKDRDLRLSGGAYGLYQDTNDVASTTRHGVLAQAKFNIWRNWLFFIYEFHHYSISHESIWQDENRYGLYGGYYYQFNERTQLDVYAETFYIPKISDDDLLSTGRASIYWDTKAIDFHVIDLLAEVYVKDSPDFWGGSRNDLRVGVKVQPFDFFSAKLLMPIASSKEAAVGEWQAQVNIYKVGDF